MIYTNVTRVLLLFLLLALSLSSRANLYPALRLQQAYPDHIIAVNEEYITWRDGATMPLHGNQLASGEKESPTLYDQINNEYLHPDIPSEYYIFNPNGDIGRIRYEPFFKKMYGSTATEVEQNLTVVYWMPLTFGKMYPLLITTINNVDNRVRRISATLDNIVVQHPEYKIYLANTTSYSWRIIAGTNNLSLHSFGNTIDINPDHADYWRWDLAREGYPVITEATPLIYRNSVPLEIVAVFENNGFIWGGKWHHYDTMHFEYRPELFT